MNSNHVDELRYQLISVKRFHDDGETIVYYPMKTFVCRNYEEAKLLAQAYISKIRSSRFCYFLVRKYDFEI